LIGGSLKISLTTIDARMAIDLKRGAELQQAPLSQKPPVLPPNSSASLGSVVA